MILPTFAILQVKIYLVTFWTSFSILFYLSDVIIVAIRFQLRRFDFDIPLAGPFFCILFILISINACKGIRGNSSKIKYGGRKKIKLAESHLEALCSS